MACEYPAYGRSRVSNELRKLGVLVSGGEVRCIWQRHGLESLPRGGKFLVIDAAGMGVFSSGKVLSG